MFFICSITPIPTLELKKSIPAISVPIPSPSTNTYILFKQYIPTKITPLVIKLTIILIFVLSIF